MRVVSGVFADEHEIAEAAEPTETIEVAEVADEEPDDEDEVETSPPGPHDSLHCGVNILSPTGLAAMPRVLGDLCAAKQRQSRHRVDAGHGPG